MRGYYVHRKGGWDCHGLPVEIEVERQLGITSKHEIERYGIAEFNQAAASRCSSTSRTGTRSPSGSGSGSTSTTRTARSTTTYIESVWWALKTIWGRRTCSTRATRSSLLPALRHRAVLTRGRARLPRRRRPDDLRARSRCPSPRGPLQAGDALLVWTTTPWTLVSNAAVAVDPELTYVRARATRCWCWPRRWWTRCSARTRRCSTASAARDPRHAATSRRSRSSPRRSTGRGPHRAGRRLRQRRGRHRPRAHRDRVRRGRLPARRAVRAERRQPGAARRHLRRAHRPVRRGAS